MKRIHILIADYYLPARIFKPFFDDKRFVFYSYCKEEYRHLYGAAKNVRWLDRGECNLDEVLKKRKIALVLGIEQGVNSFMNAPFSRAAKRANIPYINMMDGVLDCFGSKQDHTVWTKSLFALKLLWSPKLHSCARPFIKTEGIFPFLKYLMYCASQNKNRFAEDNIIHFVNGKKTLEMFSKQFAHTDTRLMGLLQLDGLLQKSHACKEKKGRVLIISQPLVRDNIITPAQHTEYIEGISKLAQNNPQRTFVFRFHPLDNRDEYAALKGISNLELQEPGKTDLFSELRSAEHVCTFFSTVLADCAWLRKKVIVLNLFHQLDNSMYVKDSLYYKAVKPQAIDFKKVDTFYARKQYAAECDQFFLSINYWKLGETAQQRFINELFRVLPVRGK